MAKTAADFILEHGADAVAKATGRERGAVDVWRYRHRFPRAAWPELQQAYPSLTVEALLKMDRAGKRAFAAEEAKREAQRQAQRAA